MQAVEKLLDGIGNPADGPFKQALDATGTMHFLSMSLPPIEDRQRAYLVVEWTADGSEDLAIDTLARAAGGTVRALFGAMGLRLSALGLAADLRAFRVETSTGWRGSPGLPFDGSPGLLAERIKAEATLARQIAELLQNTPPMELSLRLLEYVRAHLWHDEAAKWAFVTDTTPVLSPPPSKVTAIGGTVGSLAGGILWPFLLAAAAVGVVSGVLLHSLVEGLATGFVVFVGIVAGLYLMLRRAERRDIPEDDTPDANNIRSFMEHENFSVQNHFAAWSVMKPGWLRLVALRAGLSAAGVLAAYFSQPGFLAGTRVIHSARWVLMPNSGVLLFLSNFDGTWERYLEDFIELAAQGVTGIWSNTAGFPRTHTLFFGGAADGDRLRRWTRRQQYPTRVWYSAYPDLTVGRVRINAAIRRGVAAASTEAQASDWLACFGSAPRPPSVMDAPQIQTLVFGGLRRLRFGTCLLLQFPADRTELHRWMKQVLPLVSYGMHDAAVPAVIIGFSRSGLEKLGFAPDDLAQFSAAFQHGSAAPWRARANGDTGDNAPKEWRWGNEHVPIDAVALLYAPTLELLEGLRTSLVNGGVKPTCEVEFAPVPEGRKPAREPFGFVDGISDPVIRGVGHWTNVRRANNLVSPGEFVLGYPNNLGYLPASPTVSVGSDSADVLPRAPATPLPSIPFDDGNVGIGKDFGANGTYLVVRQLEQDANAFDQFLERTADRLAKEGRSPFAETAATKEWLAAKMVGRWRDGTSIIRQSRPPLASDDGNHHSPPDNDFLFRPEDPVGLSCPYGAHIRRANPRESLAIELPTPTREPDIPVTENTAAALSQLAITNRHRILRVGRGYEAQDGLEKPGLMFMCLNSDIERQFEIVQNTWLLGSSFHGLENETDPLLGVGSNRRMTIPMPDAPLILKDLPQLTRLLGASYFFLPSRRAMSYLAQLVGD